MSKSNKAIFIGVILLAVASLACAGIAKASTTGSILINIDNNGSQDPDCWVADGTCSVQWGDGSDHGHSITTGEFDNCIQQATRYASGIFNVSELDITFQMVPKVVTCNNLDKNYTTYDTYRVSYTPKSNSVTASCSASASSVQTGQAVTFIASALGSSSSYTYSWSGACTGTSSNCSNTFTTAGTKTATVNVTSGGQTASANCSVSVGQSCTPNYEQRCIGTSKYWYDSCGNQGGYIGTCGNTTSNLTVTKTVRNLTIGTGFSSSTYASPSDALMFLITLQATGNQSAQNVFVRDILPANLIYNNQLVIACSGGSNCTNNYNNSGSIAYGINLSTIYPGQTITISYQAQVAGVANFVYGVTTLNNSVSATSSNAGSVNATASVIVTRSGVLGASTISTGLTNNFWVDSFFLPLIITLIVIWMWRSGMFFGIEKWVGNKKRVRTGYKSEKELSARVANLQKSGKT